MTPERGRGGTPPDDPSPQEAPMDLLDHLVKEHRQVESLIDQLADTDPGSRRSELLDELAH